MSAPLANDAAPATGTETDEQTAAAADQGDNGATQDQQPDGADQLGDAGKKALDAMKAKWKAAEKRAADAEANLAKVGRSADEQAIEDAKRAATAEATTKANARILRSEIRRAATGKLADPGDALAFLDLTEFDVSDDGEVDEGEIDAAIADLVKRKPHLAAKPAGPVIPAGGIDQGARERSTPDLDQQIAAAEKAGNYGLSISLKRQKAAQAAPKS